MNEVLEIIKNRRSVKKYKSTPVPQELIEKVAEAGAYAPTGRNLQAPIIIAISNKEKRDWLSQKNAEILGTDTDPFYGAPVVLVTLYDKSMHTGIYDASLVMENMMLAATALGLGSCWIHRAKEVFETEEGKAFLKELGISGDYEGVGNCILGYIDGDYPKMRPRKDNYIYYVK